MIQASLLPLQGNLARLALTSFQHIMGFQNGRQPKVNLKALLQLGAVLYATLTHSTHTHTHTHTHTQTHKHSPQRRTKLRLTSQVTQTRSFVMRSTAS